MTGENKADRGDIKESAVTLGIQLDSAGEMLKLVNVLAKMQHAHRLTTLALLRSLADDKAGMYKDVEEAVETLHQSADAISVFNDSLGKRIDIMSATLDRMIANAAE